MKPLLLCPRCESAQFIIKAEPQPKDMATCARCRGRFIYGHLTDEAEAKAARAARSRSPHPTATPTNAHEAPARAGIVRRWLRLTSGSNDRTTPPPK